MSTRTRLRIGLYTVGVIALSVLTYVGWFYVPHLGLDQDKTEVFRLAGEGDWDQARRVIEVMDERYPDDVRVPLLRGWLEDGVGDLGASAVERTANKLYISLMVAAYDDYYVVCGPDLQDV